MARSQEFKPEEVVAALEQAKGLKTQAARILGCHPITVDQYAKRYVSVQQALKYEREKFVDAAEAALYSAVVGKEPWAVTFALATIGKDRGYVRREEVKHQGDEDKPVVVKHIAAAQIRAAELAFLSTLGLKSGGVGDDAGHDHPPDARADGVSPLPVPGGIPDGSEFAPTRGQGAADRL